MDKNELIEAFNDCVERMAGGQDIEQCLARYPQFEPRLRPMLEVGRLVSRAQLTPVESDPFRDELREQLVAAVRREFATPPAPRVIPFMRLATLAAVFLMVCSISGLMGVLFAELSLPGDAFYGVKQLTESLQLNFGGDSQMLGEQFARRRIEEINQLLDQQRVAEVVFQGEVREIDDAAWLIATLPIRVADDTPGSADACVGALVQVNASTTAEGILIAKSIEVLTPCVISTPPPTPTASASPTPSATAMPSATATPSATPTLTTTATASHTATPTLTATASPTATASHTATSTLTATPTPTPTSAFTPTPTVCVPHQPSGWTIYVVQTGDTLSALAVAVNVALDEVMRVNCITNARFIFVGQRIYLPNLSPISSTTGSNTTGSTTGGATTGGNTTAGTTGGATTGGNTTAGSTTGGTTTGSTTGGTTTGGTTTGGTTTGGTTTSNGGDDGGDDDGGDDGGDDSGGDG
jgi:LysM repeat protein/AcrR family transcriptional regulator